jgi:hypothetical protein
MWRFASYFLLLSFKFILYSACEVLIIFSQFGTSANLPTYEDQHRHPNSSSDDLLIIQYQASRVNIIQFVKFHKKLTGQSKILLTSIYDRYKMDINKST